MRRVGAEAWHDTVARAYDEGHDWFDWLGCVDEIGVADELRVVLSLRRLEDPGAPELLLQCRLPRTEPRRASVRDLYAGAAWHEREVAELFGVDFVGGDHHRLLLDPEHPGTPSSPRGPRSRGPGPRNRARVGRPRRRAGGVRCHPASPTRGSGETGRRMRLYRTRRRSPRRSPATGSAGGLD